MRFSVFLVWDITYYLENEMRLENISCNFAELKFFLSNEPDLNGYGMMKDISYKWNIPNLLTEIAIGRYYH